MYQLSATLKGHGQDVKDVVAVGESQLISVSRDGTVIVWTKSEDSQWQSAIISRRELFVNSVCFREKDSMVFYGAKDGLISGSPVFAKFDEDPVYTLIGHQSNVCSLSCDGENVVSGSWDKTAKVWENGVVKWDLRGHEASVWDAKAVPTMPDHYMTASADKTIKLWQADKCVKTFSGIHNDVIRHLEFLNSGNFASCSNDGTIKIFNMSGVVLQTLEGHDSFVYSIRAFPNGDLVSCGEDRSLRIWSSTGQLKQVIIIPAVSVWCVDILPNGDIVVGSSDSMLRVFTNAAQRTASAAEIEQFQQDLQNSSINSQVMGVDESKISPYEVLQSPGKKEGQIIIVKAPTGLVEAHQYSQGQWLKVGDVVSNSGSDQKKEFQGRMYDYVFDVDIEEGKPPLKLPVNANDNAYAVADQFLARYELPQSYRDQVVNFILQNTTGVSLDPDGAPAVVSTTSETPSVPTISNSYKVLPVKQYLSIKNYNPDSIFMGITKLNAKEQTFNDENLAQIGTALHDLDQNWEVLYLFALSMRSKWSTKTPAYDIVRLVVSRLSSSDDISEFIEEGLGNQDITIAMLTVRIFVNCFDNKKWGLKLMSSKNVYESIFRTIETDYPEARVQQLQNLAIAVATLLVNYSSLIVQDPTGMADAVAPISDALNTKFGNQETFQESEEAAYRLLVAFGNLSIVEPSLKQFAGSISWIKSVKAYYGNIVRFQEVLLDIGA
ncbi:DOA1 (YKL213C) [Zygosaccharomyces parabailii]|uniref:BN860_16314g1_1 n=1 Tax=Zygosaccharomyces bailii (strain CLIB 213 / ATCC 58445 / CBS 680 / BCRC 21525 / NBRC 1098 / NCYC 1416 / NRRL Y-2227) TaxID=1333698 RepID=A0A8J2WXM3_ZYGB2|nr:DOA1 (YKL213C) [Zygosaccharomyces parabailii]CDF88697.1 BN860_16314g1_1 [Zygosaccharomyces bailii CLIB 213]CDH13244.1 probable protein DOA1 [Zygosaccharomyces bailii ISA1307]